jgi:hypothetical protein
MIIKLTVLRHKSGGNIFSLTSEPISRTFFRWNRELMYIFILEMEQIEHWVITGARIVKTAPTCARYGLCTQSHNTHNGLGQKIILHDAFLRKHLHCMWLYQGNTSPRNCRQFLKLKQNIGPRIFKDNVPHRWHSLCKDENKLVEIKMCTLMVSVLLWFSWHKATNWVLVRQ